MPERDVPAVIADYCRRAVPEPLTNARGTLLEQVGTMRLAPDRPWMPFSAEQRLAATTTAFSWRARFRMAPLVTGVVEDAYEKGRGRLDAKLWGVVPLVHARGDAVDRGEAQRYLAELAWCPSALLHNPELQFRSIDERTVRVWVHDERTYVDLCFDDAGDIVGARTDTRSRGDEVQPWEGRFFEPRAFEGVIAPSRAEVWWEAPDGRFVYWRGEVRELRFFE